MSSYILSIDQGTSSCRAFLIDLEGHVVASCQKEIPLDHPQHGWVEQDAEEIWKVQLETIHALFTNEGFSIDDVISIGITNQRET